MSGAASPPVLLLHGCGGSAQATFIAPGWVTAFAAAGRSTLVPHLPGHGPTPQSRDPSAYADLAGVLLAQLPPGPFDAVGFSLGAKLVLDIAVRQPARLRRAVLGGIGDNLFAPEVVAEAAAQVLERGADDSTPPALRRFLAEWDPAANDALAVAAVLRRPPNPQFDPQRARQANLPLLIVNGEQDPVASLGSRLSAALPRARWATLAQTGHFELPRNPEFLHLALDFLTREEAA